MTLTFRETIDLLRDSLEAAGLERDADPKLLPERISELRFVGNCFVPQTYPRRTGNDAERPVEKTAGGSRVQDGYRNDLEDLRAIA